MDEKELIEEVEEVDGHEAEEVTEPVEETSFGKKLINRDTFIFSVRDIAEMGILCALAIVFDKFVTIGIGENGGSINIAMLPLFIIALRQGWFKGFISGAIIFGLITCATDKHPNWLAYPLDYFIGFGSVGLLGVFKPFITDEDYNITWHSYAYSTVGILAAYVLRFFAATIDGILVYETDLIGSMVYNAPYIFLSFIAVCALFLGLLINILKAFRAHNTKSL